MHLSPIFFQFVAEGVDGVCAGGTQGLQAYSQHRDQEGQQGESEQPGACDQDGEDRGV